MATAFCPVCKRPMMQKNVQRHIETAAYGSTKRPGDAKHLSFLRSQGSVDESRVVSGRAPGDKGQAASGRTGATDPPPLKLRGVPTPGAKVMDEPTTQVFGDDDIGKLSFADTPDETPLIAPVATGEVGEVPFDNTEIMTQFAIDLSEAFATGDLSSFKMTKKEVKAFARSMARYRKKDVDDATLIFVTGSKLIITIIGNILIGITKVFAKMKERKATKEKEAAEAAKEKEESDEN